MTQFITRATDSSSFHASVAEAFTAATAVMAGVIVFLAFGAI